jgi:tetratricopeptide (TPR) repeat protein
LIGNWITYDTSVKEITEFVDKVYIRRDYSGFTGDRKFLRDDQAQKAFSKLRSSIAGIYAWRLGMSGTFTTPVRYQPKSEAERQRMIREADFALRQAFAFCPYSPEAVFRYVQLLLNTGRLDDALLVAETCLKLDPDNPSVVDLVKTLRGYRQNSEVTQLQNQIVQLEREWQTNPGDFPKAFDLVVKYAQAGRPDRATQILDTVLSHSNLTPHAAINAAELYRQLNNHAKLETALRKVVQLAPDEPEGWYNLAATEATLSKPSQAMNTLRRALELNQQRLGQNSNAPDIRRYVATDPRLDTLRNLPEFRTLTASP